MKRLIPALGFLLAAMLACIPGSTTIRDAQVTVTTFIDEGGTGVMPEPPSPLPDTLVIATWNVHGGMSREVKLTDQNGQAVFSVSYTHFFDISVFPPCGYYSTTPLYRDMTEVQEAGFGFWPACPGSQSSRVRVMVWEDANSNGTQETQEQVADLKASVMFKIPHGMHGNVFDRDDFLQETRNGWFDIPLGNSCGTIYLLLLDSERETSSVSEPGKISDAGSHGNTYYPSIEIPYGPGETTVYWEMK
ncbi:MAG: hypothetical protein HGA28_05845 [Anaerolineaceae bacterium]|nr:hypothetical protein [Anaerolineaceae bacterium]